LDVKTFFPDRPKSNVETKILPIQKKDDKPVEIPKKIQEENEKSPKVETIKTVRIGDITLQRTGKQLNIIGLELPKEDKIEIEINAVEVTTIKPKLEPIIIKESTTVKSTTIRPTIATTLEIKTTKQTPTKPQTKSPSTTSKQVPTTSYKNNEINKCSDTCCDDNRPQILMSRAAPDSCCKGVSKIVIPIEMEKLARISTSEIIDITNESNNHAMLNKLIKLVEKYEL
jgi:hypothetical protein